MENLTSFDDKKLSIKNTIFLPVQTNPIYLEHSQTYYNMEEAKKKRTNELLSLIQYRNDNQEVTDKIAHVKHAMDELGDIQDELISLIDEQGKEAVETLDESRP